MAKYILSTGKVTDRVDIYVADIFKLYLGILPGDIPGYRSMGFNFNLGGTSKPDIIKEVSERFENLIDRISSTFSGVKIEVENLELISDTTIHATIRVDDFEEELNIEI